MNMMTGEQFLRVAAQTMPTDFRVLTVLACDYARYDIDNALKNMVNKEEAITAKKRLSSQYKKIIIKAKAQGFGPGEKIGPYQIVNFSV